MAVACKKLAVNKTTTFSRAFKLLSESKKEPGMRSNQIISAPPI